jgi:hypothetical protein
MDREKPHFLSDAGEICFLQFKELVFLKIDVKERPID